MRRADSERALILAPLGRDAAVAAAMLGEIGVEAEIVRTLPGLVDSLAAGAGFVVTTEEALRTADLHGLSQWLGEQPDWSDLPFVLLTSRGGGLEQNPAARRYLEMLGNVTFLERPFHPTTLVSVARSALRARRRQYEARGRLDALNESERQFRTLANSLEDKASDLEARVAERTAEREHALAQLHEAQKLETIGQLTGGVAHDFNNLLTPITGVLDMLQRRYGRAETREAKLIAGALQSAERAKTLVQRLLGFARRQPLQTGPVDLVALLDGMRDLIASSIGPAIELQVSSAADLPSALADANQLELAVLNLAVNARDAMPDGGTLTIMLDRAAIGPRDEPRLKPGLYLRLSVLDSGIGMDAETLRRAIEPFFSTKGVGKGTGLGLSMIHGLAAQLGGGFRLSSAVGEGTRADLWLPAAAGSELPGTAPHLRETLGPSRPLTILLVDDEELVRTGTAEMLRDLGHEVVEASGGAQALGKLGARLRVDAVVTDYRMPRMDGAELAARIRALDPAMPILLVTGYTDFTGDAPDLPRLAKPFRQADLSGQLNALFQNRSNVVPLKRG